MLSDQQQYRYMTVDDMKSMGDDSMRVNVTDDERDNRHSGGELHMCSTIRPACPGYVCTFMLISQAIPSLGSPRTLSANGFLI